MKVLLINPPRYYWPFLNEGDNYLLPQALPILAAALRENDMKVRPIDCPPLKMGWKTLAREIEKEHADMVGVATSETMFSHEGLKACRLAKEIDPETVTVLGGHHFSSQAEETLRNDFVDFIVIGEGDYTLPELAKETEKSKPQFKKISGIAFRNKSGKTVITKPRPLIDDLDDLPIPAYDLMPMSKYGSGPILWSPGGTTISHSRGCIGNCSFCACWVHMSRRTLKRGRLTCFSCWRTKSVERTIAEVELLRRRYHKKFLVFVDDTWNVDPEWNIEFSKMAIENNLGVKWHAFMRADFILRDEKQGIMQRIVDAGLSHLCIGAERVSNKELELLKKKDYTQKTVLLCFNLLKRKYPQVFRQVTFMVGFRNETRQSLSEIARYAKEIDADFPSFHPITPVPGTEVWEQARKNHWLEISDFRYYDWTTPIMRSSTLSRNEMERILAEINRSFFDPARFLTGLLSRHGHRRNMYAWCMLVSSKVLANELYHKLTRTEAKGRRIRKQNPFMQQIKPEWYDF